MPELPVPGLPVLVAPADLAAHLGRALSSAGVPVPLSRVADLAAAVRLVPPVSRGALYWTARATLLGDVRHARVFDAVFAAVFDGQLDPADSRGQTPAPPSDAPPAGRGGDTRPPGPGSRQVDGELPPGTARPTPGTGSASDLPEREVLLATASAAERLGTTPFAELSAQEVLEVSRLVRRVVLATPVRRTRRTRRTHRRGGDRLDLRATLRAAQRTGGDPVRLVHRRRRNRPRRLVLLCDVSASMDPHTAVYLTLLQGAVTYAGAEAFVFSTRLTRLTRELRAREGGLARAMAAVPDRAGGTRLAEGLRRFLDDHGRRGTARGAVVVVLSDGWSQDEPEAVATQMQRLRRLAFRIVWVNPRLAAPGYAPLVGGMAAALPSCDAFVSGHTLTALADLAEAVRAPHRSSTRRDT